MDRLAEQSLLTPELQGSNPVFDKFLHRTFAYCELRFWKDENKEKEPGKGPLKLTHIIETGSQLRNQCDLMTRLFIQFLAIYNNEKFAIRHKKFDKVGWCILPHINDPTDFKL